ncbi:MAG: aconitase X catalytic domain-containing protein [Methanothrix sp.]|nr:aconitase X catalytic domain-containing protein [Methanothrix sp.]
MYLSREEEEICRGDHGPTLQKMMNILVALGEIYGAERLVPVRSAQIAGVSFKNIGDAGLQWISDLNGRVRVPSILNPSGMDLCRWKEMGITEEFAYKQQATIDAYRKLGITPDCTCTPYQLYDSLASRGDHLAWSESSAVSYANSVIGAMTNREGGPSALAAALIGKTPKYGYHLDENRMPTHLVEIKDELAGADYGAVGFLVGRIVKDGVPIFHLRSRPKSDELKALGASMAASGSVALYYVENVTPPAPPGAEPEEKITIDRSDVDDVYKNYSGRDADIIALGCPHCSMQELEQIAKLLEGETVKKELWVCTARKIAESCPELVAKIEASGARVFCDTCMVVSPACERYKKMMVNSGKALIYIPGLCGIQAGFGTLKECIDVALGRL